MKKHIYISLMTVVSRHIIRRRGTLANFVKWYIYRVFAVVGKWNINSVNHKQKILNKALQNALHINYIF